MGIEHELGQGPMQPGQRASEGHEAGPGKLGGRIEVHPAVAGPQVHVVLGLEGKRRRLAPAALFPVGRLVPPVRHGHMRDVGNVQAEILQLLLHHRKLILGGFEPRTQVRHFSQQGLDVLTGGFGLADALGADVALVLQLLGGDL